MTRCFRGQSRSNRRMQEAALGSQPPTIGKCVHSVFNGGLDGDRSDFCSICAIGFSADPPRSRQRRRISGRFVGSDLPVKLEPHFKHERVPATMRPHGPPH